MEMFLTIKLCTYAKLNCFSIERIIYIKMDLALNNLQRLICHKTKQTKQTKLKLSCYEPTQYIDGRGDPFEIKLRPLWQTK